MAVLNATPQADLVIIGAGIIGAAVARDYLARFPHHHVLMLERADRPAAHQTGRNSGVVHAGVYYPPGSLKSTLCREGLDTTLAYCRDHQLPVEQCGKVIVATDETEAQRLDTLYSNCKANDLQPERWSTRQIRSHEPAIRGTEGVYVRHTGITDYAAITRHMLSACKATGQFTLATGAEVETISEGADSVTLEVKQHARRVRVKSQALVCCAGVRADQLIRTQLGDCDFAILPFKGEYFRLSPRFDAVSSRLIYPVPDPAMPFLGVHLTRMIGGYTTVGPNAVLAAGREAYTCLDTSLAELGRILRVRGLYPLLWRFKRAVVSELITSLSKHAYASRIQRYCPAVTVDDFTPYRSGIRAQAVSRNGELMQDFHFVQTQRVLHVGNAPSPAATSAIPIARTVVDRLL
ncbi:L-2-hydroxyglutarate oxidase [Alteromonas halophila]|nr:L-2-hydroxyglutarate oxidase [Alteromonas halophila]